MSRAPREYVIYEAHIPLLDPRYSADTVADSLHIVDGAIRWVGRAGTADAPVDRDGRSRLPVHDARGATVLPGFIDNHVHTLITGDQASQPHLYGMAEAEIVRTVRELDRQLTPGVPLSAYGWDYPFWPEPHRRVLDAITIDRPIVLYQFSGHGACVNSAMLRVLDITRRTPDPHDGHIERDSDGEPTGILREGASRPIHVRRLREIHRNRQLAEELLLRGLETFARHGITGVGDNTWYAGSAFALMRLRKAGRLPCRISCWSLGRSPREALGMRFARYDRRFVRRGPVKHFLDGAFSTRTAALLEPYDDDPENSGARMFDDPALLGVLRRLTFRGRQGAFHAIGDRAVRQFLDAAEQLSQRSSRVTRLRHRLEHCQLVSPPDIERFARLGVHAAAQPHAIATPEKDERLLGRTRAARAYPYRSLLDAGAALSFGSDSPAEATFAPLEGIRRAVLRPGAERITVREAIECYTAGSARAEGTEAWKGSIGAGMAADFVFLSHDPTELDRSGDETALRSAAVTATVVNGQPVYEQTPGSFHPV